MIRSLLGRAVPPGAVLVTTVWLATFAQPTASQSAQPQEQAQQAQDPLRPPAFRAGANFVLVDAYPRVDGRLIEGLTADDFAVLEDGVPQAIEEFEFVEAGGLLPVAARRDPSSLAEGEIAARDPRSRVFVFFLDGEHTNVEGTRRATTPSLEFLNNVTGPGDLFSFVTPEVPVTAMTFSRELAAAQRAVERYWEQAFVNRSTQAIVEPRTADEAMVYQCFISRYFEPTAGERLVRQLIGKIRRERTLTRLRELVARLTGLRDARSHVLLFSGGWGLEAPDPDLTQHAWRQGPPQLGTDPFGRLTTERNEPGEPSNTTACDSELMRLALLDERLLYQETLDEARRSNVSIHAVDPSGLAAFDDEGLMTRDSPSRRGLTAAPFRDRLGTLRSLAGATDGTAIVATNDLTTPMRELARELSSYYLLGYYSTNQEFDGDYRRIEVRLRGADRPISARRGYVAPTPEAVLAGDAAREAAAATAAARATVEQALGDLSRLDGVPELFVDAYLVRGEIVALAEAPPEAIGRYLEEGAVAQMVVSAPGGETLAEDRHPFPQGRPASLYRVEAPPIDGDVWRVIFRVQGDLSPLSQTLDVQAEPEAPLMARMVFRATPASRSPLWPAPSRLFTRRERVHVEWTVPGPLDARDARLLGRAGDALAVPVTLTETTELGRSILSADLRLAPLAPGDYVIEVTATFGGETKTDLVAIRVKQ